MNDPDTNCVMEDISEEELLATSFIYVEEMDENRRVQIADALLKAGLPYALGIVIRRLFVL